MSTIAANENRISGDVCLVVVFTARNGASEVCRVEAEELDGVRSSRHINQACGRFKVLLVAFEIALPTSLASWPSYFGHATRARK